jgi:hypothetical protein
MSLAVGLIGLCCHLQPSSKPMPEQRQLLLIGIFSLYPCRVRKEGLRRTRMQASNPSST